MLANRLSADPGNRVLLLEAGGPDRNPWITSRPATIGRSQHRARLGLRNRARARPERPRVTWPRGKTLGGSSAINGLVYIRGQRRISTAGGSSATPAGRMTTCCPISSAPRTRSAAPTSTTARAAVGGSDLAGITAVRRVHRAPRGGHPAQRRFQRRRAGRRRLLSAHHRAAALLDGGRLSAPGPAAANLGDRDPRAGHRSPSGPAAAGVRYRQQRRARDATAAEVVLSAAPSTRRRCCSFGHRAGGAAARARHPGGTTCRAWATCRTISGARGLSLQSHHAQRLRQQSAQEGADGARFAAVPHRPADRRAVEGGSSPARGHDLASRHPVPLRPVLAATGRATHCTDSRASPLGLPAAPGKPRLPAAAHGRSGRQASITANYLATETDRRSWSTASTTPAGSARPRPSSP